MTNVILERSVLDFFVVCARVLPFVKRMVIYEEKDFILTNYQNVQKRGKAVDSDHFTQFMDLDLKFETEKPQRVEILNFKDKEGQIKFRKLTSETDAFSKCFMSDEPLLIQIRKWRNTLDTFWRKSFKKIRIRKKKIKPLRPRISNLIDKRNKLSLLPDVPGNQEKIYEISQEIADDEAQENRDLILRNFKDFSDNPEA